MKLFGNKSRMPTPEEALPGRSQRMPVPAKRHFVNGRADRAAVPGGTGAGGVRHGLLLGRRAQVLADRRACTRPRSATPAATRRTRPTRRCARARPVTTRWCSSSSIPTRISYEALLRVFWESHDPDAGHAAGQRRRHAVPLGHLLHGRRAARARRGVARRLPERARRGGGLRRDHHRDPAGARVLLRRGLSPAVPGEEPDGYCGLGGCGVAFPPEAVGPR